MDHDSIDDSTWDLSKVRHVTRSLIEAVMFDVFPTPAAATDFGIKTQEHYEAIYYPIRNEEFSFAQLDEAYGNGPKLTELVNAAPSNPHKGIQFETPWDVILGREQPKKVSLEELRQQGQQGQAATKDRGREMDR